MPRLIRPDRSWGGGGAEAEVVEMREFVRNEMFRILFGCYKWGVC